MQKNYIQKSIMSIPNEHESFNGKCLDDYLLRMGSCVNRISLKVLSDKFVFHNNHPYGYNHQFCENMPSMGKTGLMSP